MNLYLQNQLMQMSSEEDTVESTNPIKLPLQSFLYIPAFAFSKCDYRSPLTYSHLHH